MGRKYKAPKGCTSISIGGVELLVNKKGIVDVPDDASDEDLQSHGFRSVDDIEADATSEQLAAAQAADAIAAAAVLAAQVAAAAAAAAFDAQTPAA
jgi:uncharacterized protein with beta-barrel porin domain